MNGVRPHASSNGTAKSAKMVYFFGKGKTEGNVKMKDALGGKGANLADMTSIGLPVPPGFTITNAHLRQVQRGRPEGSRPRS